MIWNHEVGTAGARRFVNVAIVLSQKSQVFLTTNSR